MNIPRMLANEDKAYICSLRTPYSYPSSPTRRPRTPKLAIPLVRARVFWMFPSHVKLIVRRILITYTKYGSKDTVCYS